MEFGIFLNGYIPGPGAHDSDWEHRQLMREAEYAIFADKHNWKYAWFGEHHCLTEYSHMSAPEVIMGMVAGQTDYIHLASGINSLSPRKEHPVRLAERAAMLDHVTDRRYEWGTGRGAGSHEMASFNILDTNSTKAEWDEVVREIPRMWEQVDYTHHGEHFTVPTPHNVLPEALRPRAIRRSGWRAATRRRSRRRASSASARSPSTSSRSTTSAAASTPYKEGIANCTEPLGQFMNDNIMMTNGVHLLRGPREGAAHRARAGQRLPRDDGEPVPRHDAEVAGRDHVAVSRRSCCATSSATAIPTSCSIR